MDPLTAKFLKTFKTRTKSDRGGKRPGAGRPRDPGSIRGQLEESVIHHVEHPDSPLDTPTRWYFVRHTYLWKYGIRAVKFLTVYRDLDRSRIGSVPMIPLLSEHQGYRIAHLSPEEQLYRLQTDNRDVLVKALRQWEPKADHKHTAAFVKVLKEVLEAKPKKPV
jgi:hypothetical protein